jgi:hypothetical protein
MGLDYCKICFTNFCQQKKTFVLNEVLVVNQVSAILDICLILLGTFEGDGNKKNTSCLEKEITNQI